MNRGTPEYEAKWVQRAAEYRKALEEKNTVITHPFSIRRALVVRWKSYMRSSVTFRDTFWLREGDMDGGVLDYVRKHRSGVESVVRIWLVLTHEGFVHQKWERLVMAQAHRDGLMFQYAKHLMTEESDTWTKELSGGSQRGRR